MIAIPGTNPSYEGQAVGENRAGIRVILGASGAGCIANHVARGGCAAEYMCSGALRVLVTPASSSVVNFREVHMPEA
jgi:hypothetical protein